jgi:hypothetical protein
MYGGMKTSKNKEDNMDTKSASKIVPEIYYDFIARLIPGVALVICIDPLRSLLFL